MEEADGDDLGEGTMEEAREEVDLASSMRVDAESGGGRGGGAFSEGLCGT